MRNYLYNNVVSEAIPQTRNWGLLLVISVLVGIIACNKIFPMFIPAYESVYTFAAETNI